MCTNTIILLSLFDRIIEIQHSLFYSGHTLGTSLFSPPPSTSSRPALFSHSFIGKGDGPCHPPIGTGKRSKTSAFALQKIQ